jgi:hypothetical protein
MFRGAVEKSAASISAISLHLSISERFRTMLSVSDIRCKARGAKCFDVEGLASDPPDPTEWRVIDHCAAITRMYAVFEGFVDSILRDYLNFLNSNYHYAELNENFRSNYVRGMGIIVAESHKQRYQHLPVHSLATDLAAALAGETPYRITAEAMLIQEQNLRLGELERIFGHCGLPGLRSWIEHHLAITNFFTSAARVSDTAEAELREVVGYRNEAAHGEVDNVLGVAILTEFAEFIFYLCAAIAEFVQKDMLTRLLAKQHFHDAGEVAETFRGNVMVGKIENATVSVGVSRVAISAVKQGFSAFS